MSKQGRKVTEAQISAWKKQYGDHRIYALDIEIEAGDESTDPDVATMIYVKPGLTEVLAAEEAGAGDSIKQNIFLFNQCFLGGDERFQQSDDVKLSAANAIAKSFKTYEATTKKL